MNRSSGNPVGRDALSRRRRDHDGARHPISYSRSSGNVIMSIESTSAPGESSGARHEREHDRESPEAVQPRRRHHAEARQDDDDQRKLEREAEREHDLQHEAEVGVVGDHRLERLALWKLKSTRRACGTTNM